MKIMFLLFVILFFVLGPVLAGDKQGTQQKVCLKELKNPFLRQVISQESRSVIDCTALDRLQKRVV